MRVHYVLNHGGTPASKLADVEIHFEEGLLAGLKLVGASVWRSKKGEAPTVIVPSRSYATAAGVRYYELLRPSADGLPPAAGVVEDPAAKQAVRRFKEYVRDEYCKIASLPDAPPAAADRPASRKTAPAVR
ncbi:MAG: hypothetical protein H6Q84_1314 [Deltaproteobacteria bacterium]|nr:hypothetical protein [Deltaproteobacteria bacterium]